MKSGKACTGEFTVINGNSRVLLGKETAEKMGVLRVGPTTGHHVCSVTTEGSNGDIIEQYPEGVGKLKNYQESLHIDDSVKPIAQPVRRLPFGLWEKVDSKLDELLREDIIEEVISVPTKWVSPVVAVPKSNQDIRLCVDMRKANMAIIRERHYVPTIEEVLSDLQGSTIFSKCDLKWGFHQIELDEKSRDITTLITHRGLYRYKRLLFGITSAPEKYQKIIKDVLQGCPGVANIADDLIIHGKGLEEHDRHLFGVLKRLKKCGLTLNADKCQFRLPKLTFYRHDLSRSGVSPSEEKVMAIRNAKAPQNSSEIRSFLGLVQYSAKFIPDFATVSEPLRQLTRKNVKFVWGRQQAEAFEKLKEIISKAETLAYFKNNCKTRIVGDAGPTGLGAVLLQQQHGIWRVVSYASRNLTDVERRYS